MITDRNGNQLFDGDIICINPDDDEWYDAVLDMDGKGLELASFDPALAHIRCKLEDVTDNCDKVFEPTPDMWAEIVERLWKDMTEFDEQ